MRIFFLSLLLFLLVGCSTKSINQTTQRLLNREMILNSANFLSETKYISWISWDLTIDSKLICPPEENGLPSLAEYQKNPIGWSKPQLRDGAQFRILGLLPEGTRYHFYKIVVPERWTQAPPILYAMIDSGKFKGTTAFLKYNKHANYANNFD